MIFFDVDDTIIDHSRAQHSAALALWHERSRDIRCSDEAFPAVWRRAAIAHFAAFARGECTFHEQQLRCVREACALPDLETEQAENLLATYQRHYEAAWMLFPDVVPALTALAGYEFRVGILSVGDTGQQLKKLETFGLLGRLEAVLIADEGARGRARENIFLWASRETLSLPRDCLYVTADLKNDVPGATAAGWNAAWLDRSGLMRPTDGTAVFSSLRQVPDWALRHLS